MSGIVFLGSDDVAAACLDVLGAARVDLVVTQPRRRRGRGGAETPTPVAEAATRLGIDVMETPNINMEAALTRIVAAKPRLVVVVAFGQILRQEVLDTAPAVNLHFSLLPRWRGAAPVQRSILAGDAETGVAVQRVVAKLDAGPVVALSRTPIGPQETTPQLMARLRDVGAALLADVVDRLLAGESMPETPQDESLVVYAAKIGKDEGDLDFAAEDAAALDRRVRAFGEAPGCRTVLLRASTFPVEVLLRETRPEEGGADEPGRVLAVSAAGIVVAAKAGALRITRLQRAGGKEMDVRSFLNGVRVEPGDWFERPQRDDDNSDTSDS